MDSLPTQHHAISVRIAAAALRILKFNMFNDQVTCVALPIEKFAGAGR
jgi:hypothetical protein